MKEKTGIFITLIFLILSSVLFFNACEKHVNFEEYKNNGTVVESEICPVKNDYEAIATVISDDGYYESGKILSSLAEELKINVTVAGAVKIIKANLKEWQEIEKKGYVDVVNHSYTHIKISPEKNFTRTQIEHEYKDAKKFYEKNFSTPAFTFVAPENITTETGFAILKENGILAARLGIRGENPLSGIKYGSAPGEWLNLKMRGLYDVTNNTARNNWVDSAITNRTWLIEMWHDISPSGNVGFQPISTKDAHEHLSYLSQKQKDKKLWVASFTQAVSYIYQKDNGTVSAYMLKDSIAVSYEKHREDLPWNDFNTPVTVKISIPENWDSVDIQQGKNELDYERKGNNIIFNMETDEEPVLIEKD